MGSTSVSHSAIYNDTSVSRHHFRARRGARNLWI